ncbi:acyl-CoA thioesterase [Megasphaera stantonii]|uniref:acyl-CoA thioesterase n=1 Tax=Megasphaera stantonii TaxID=2144175 RepID=UPI001D21F63D|nr:hotdog domain-containing protein [Megasphaera stantonii]HJE82490.1 hypothetical protein [Megasphaera stantonii]
MTGIDRHVSAAHMVLGKDLNPHDTLFAGQAASYMIECGFLAVQSFLNSGHIVCLGLDGLRFLRPVRKGDTIDISSIVVYAGTTSVGAHIAMTRRSDGAMAAECFVSFVHIEEETGQALPHGVMLPALDEQGEERRRAYLAYKGMTV